MIKNYNSFLHKEPSQSPIYEANVKTKITRADLKVGDYVMTHDEFDGVNLDYQIGRIIKMGEYGNLLIEFNDPCKKFHAGFKNVGKKGHCFYVPLDNIVTNNREEFEKIIRKAGEEKKSRVKRLNASYSEGDIIVGIGVIKNSPYGGGKEAINVDGEVGIVYYEHGKGGLNAEDRNVKNNAIYWVGFLDRFNKTMNHDAEGLPKNRAGMYIDKIHMREATEEEKVLVAEKLGRIKTELDELKKDYKPGTVVMANGNANGIQYKDNLGIVRGVYGQGAAGGGYGYGGGGTRQGRKQYIIQFMERFNDYLQDVNFMIGDNTGGIVGKGFLREATPEEQEKFKVRIKDLQDDIEEYNHEYKIGEYVITHGMYEQMNLDGQIGVIKAVQGKKPQDIFTIQFISNFSPRLYKIGKDTNCYNIYRRNLSPSKGVDIEEIKRKLEAKEILPFQVSMPMSMLLGRINIKIKSVFLNMSFFDVTDKSDQITYMPVERYRRLEAKEDPYKSKLRQPMKIGKFFRVLNPDLTDKDVEQLINSFRAAYDICISGVSDKLKLVAGEDVRFWYNGDNYVKGGGILNSSCMQGAGKGREMQMFVDNPDVIQMLVLISEKNKLLGRALIWHLVVPAGAVYMDYIYTRYDKDRELFQMYAEQRGWLSGDSRRAGGRPTGGMVCALSSDKDYVMGRNALDHFDTFHYLNTAEGYLSTGGAKWERPNPRKKQREKEEPKIDLKDTRKDWWNAIAKKVGDRNKDDDD